MAGEMGAKFIAVGLSDVLDMWLGSSERNLHELFMLARREAPVVLFIDEIDALGQKRSTQVGAMRGTVNQLLAELDGVGADNEGVYILAATNQPWDIDPALRRPGRLDRTVLVLPPDRPAREAVLRHHLRDRLVAGIDLGRLAKATDGYSGADLAYVCESAAERALLDGARTGHVRMIDMRLLEWAMGQLQPSTRGWFDIARNVVMFADNDGSYAELRAWMKKRKLL
ncbi:MAG TPA: ATP-binding protein [Actinophytocola sp.]|nr:ATP-binding protein [Actinophytocola sp.]